MADDEHEHENGSEEESGTEDEGLAQRVEEAVRGVLGKLLGSGEVGVEEEGGESSRAGTLEPPSSTSRQQEVNAEEVVRQALAKVTHEDEHAKEHERMKREAERPPRQFSRLTKALWGSDAE